MIMNGSRADETPIEDFNNEKPHSVATRKSKVVRIKKRRTTQGSFPTEVVRIKTIVHYEL